MFISVLRANGDNLFLVYTAFDSLLWPDVLVFKTHERTTFGRCCCLWYHFEIVLAMFITAAVDGLLPYFTWSFCML